MVRLADFNIKPWDTDSPPAPDNAHKLVTRHRRSLQKSLFRFTSRAHNFKLYNMFKMNGFVSIMSFPAFSFKEEMEKTCGSCLEKGCVSKSLTCLVLIQSKVNFDPLVL